MDESLPGRRAISPVELLFHVGGGGGGGCVQSGGGVNGGGVAHSGDGGYFQSGGVDVVHGGGGGGVRGGGGSNIVSLLLIGLIIFDIEMKVLSLWMGTCIHRSLLSSLRSRDRHRAWSICN